MKEAHQLVEAKYDSRQDFINRAKYEVNINFEAFVKKVKLDDPADTNKKSPTFVEDLIRGVGGVYRKLFSHDTSRFILHLSNSIFRINLRYSP